jgi:large conductance mechanosensitive channel
MKKFLAEFAAFLKEYKVISLAIAFVMGTASTGLINSFVNDIFMPLIAPILGTPGSWRAAMFRIGHNQIMYGDFIGQLINFLVIALVIFIAVRFFFKEGK